MDTITHAVVGAMLVRARPVTDRNLGLSRTTQSLVVAGAAMFPDLDYLGFWINPYLFITQWHRGISHSLLMLPIWSLLLGSIVAWITGQYVYRRQCVLLCGLGLLSHIGLDLLTLYGTQIFSPISNYRAGLWLTFDADICFALIAWIGFIAGRSRVSITRWCLTGLVAYIASQTWLQHTAEKIAGDFALRSGLKPSAIHALPQPYGLFYWKLVVATSTQTWCASLRVLPGETGQPHPFEELFPVLSTFKPADRLQWNRTSLYGSEDLKPYIIQVWKRPEFAPFRNFAQLPVYYGMDSDPMVTCVWFTDLRYLIPGLIPAFRYGMCRSAGAGDWHLFRLKRSRLYHRQRLR